LWAPDVLYEAAEMMVVAMDLSFSLLTRLKIFKPNFMSGDREFLLAR
jgi:hypothetical protein